MPRQHVCCPLDVLHASALRRLIMASSDIAAILASVGISFWTQVSFKQPLLAAAAACLTGMCRVQGGM